MKLRSDYKIIRNFQEESHKGELEVQKMAEESAQKSQKEILELTKKDQIIKELQNKLEALRESSEKRLNLETELQKMSQEKLKIQSELLNAKNLLEEKEKQFKILSKEKLESNSETLSCKKQIEKLSETFFLDKKNLEKELMDQKKSFDETLKKRENDIVS